MYYNSQKNESLPDGTYSYFHLTGVDANTCVSIKSGEGYLGGITVNSNQCGVMALWNGTATLLSNIMHSSITLAAGADRDFGGERFKDGLAISLTGTSYITIRYK